MFAMVRRAFAIDRSNKVRVTPITELVQIRVYRKIPDDSQLERRNVDISEQDAYEFVIDRQQLFAGGHGLRSVGPNDPAEPFQRETSTLNGPGPGPDGFGMRQLQTCIHCHHKPGIHSVTSIQRGLKQQSGEIFRTYAKDVELNYSVWTKVHQYNWGLLQGELEASAR
jgi:hypothetical protein